ncbi:hypothetical protein KGY73_10645 [bacterium]|nr:hypothetical protein [bacterium]
MSFQSRRELTAKVAPRYREANKRQKSAILDEFLASTGYKRKYAIRLLSLPEIPPAQIPFPASSGWSLSPRWVEFRSSYQSSKFFL